MFLSLVIAIAFTCIVPIEGDYQSLKQKVCALEKRLQEMEPKLETKAYVII